MLRTWILAAAAFTVTLSATTVTTVAQPASAWQIGPIIGGRNHSVGMPPTPARARGAVWSFEFPGPSAGHVHYVTLDTGPLEGASSIVVRYRVEAARGVTFVPHEAADQPATVSLYFQRAGDSWRGKRHEFHRWYSPAQ